MPNPQDSFGKAQDSFVYLERDFCMRKRGYAIDEEGPRELWPIQMRERFGVECPIGGLYPRAACYTLAPNKILPLPVR
jgi:hypothetical protein